MIPRRALVIAAAFGAGAFAAGFAASRWLRRAPAGDAGPGVAGGRTGGAVSSPSTNEAPDFRFVDQHGAQHRFSDWRGSVRVVNFWATWCPPCVHEIPILIAIQESFRARGVQVVGVAADEPAGAFAMAKELGMNYPTMADSHGSIELMHAYGNRAGVLPFTAFVDAQGSIRARHAGALTLEQTRAEIGALLS